MAIASEVASPYGFSADVRGFCVMIGEREVATRDLPDGTGKAGDTLSWSSATTTVVNGVPPKYRR